MQLVPKEQRAKDWPKSCIVSWLESFDRWADADEGKQLSRATVAALRHMLQANLLYIEELELEAKQND